MKIIERITLARRLLLETTDAFGARFGKTGSIVSYWEKGKSEAPYEVIEFCEQVIEELEVCTACNGTGVFNKTQKSYCVLLGEEGMDMIFPAGEFHYKRDRTLQMKMTAGKPERNTHFDIPDESLASQKQPFKTRK